jgi:hypothetical protein
MWLSNNILTLVAASADCFEVIIGPVLWDLGFKRAVERCGGRRMQESGGLYIASVACN